MPFGKRTTRYDSAYGKEPNKPALGIFLGGYSSQQFFPSEYECTFPSDKDWKERRPNQSDGRPTFGADWFGQNDALTRLIKGYDPKALDELVKRGVDKGVLEKWVADGIPELPLIFDGMPIQDAIDFAEYAIQVTIGRFRFAVGPPLCGGDIDIAVITPDAYYWAQRKKWSIKE